MKTRSNKHKCCDEEGICRDRLSELPDEILVHILSFLPMIDAVRTVLLRGFGKLWTLLRTLQFDKRDFDMCEDDLLIKWTKLALRKKARVLTILFLGDWVLDNYDVNLPPHVFTSQYLVSLTVQGFVIKLPRRVFMGSLRKLKLANVTMTDDMFKVLISGCPCLRELAVFCPYDLEQLHFTAPSIEKLELWFEIGDTNQESEVVDRYYSLNCPNLRILRIEEVFIKNLELIDVSSVRKAVIRYGCTREAEPDQDHFEILLEKFRNTKVFQLDNNKAYLQLEHCGNKKQAFVRNRWTHLALRSRIRGSCLLRICRLLRNSRYLNELIIYANVDFFCECNMLLFELSFPCVMGQLRIVTICDFEKPCQALIQLIEFLLKSAVVLDKLVIVCNQKDKLISVEGHEFILQLLSFPRSSLNAKVVFA